MKKKKLGEDCVGCTSTSADECYSYRMDCRLLACVRSWNAPHGQAARLLLSKQKVGDCIYRKEVKNG